MTRILEAAHAGTNATVKEEVLHIEDARPRKKSRFARTKDLTAADIASIAAPPPVQNYNLLQASPYNDRAHLLDLTTLAKPLQLFAEALTAMRWIKQEYATSPYDKAFNWDSIVDIFSRTARAEQPGSIPEKLDFYVIVFRSRVNQHADRQLLGELDKAAHREAVESGGLLKYWFGEPDEAGRNLATCEFSRSIVRLMLVFLILTTPVIGLWRNRADARRGGAGPGHAQAMRAAVRMYDEWFVERLKLTVEPKTGYWSFATWVDDSEQTG
jgi:hypothetical protein